MKIWPPFLARSLKPLFIFFSEPPLFPIIKQIIHNEGPITIERYMEIVLQQPLFGYYKSGDPIGGGKDFSTAPETGQLFGEMIGVWCVDTWQKIGKPDPFVLLELGPGHGTLLNDLLQFTESVPAFHKALRIHLFESDATLRGIQQEKLAKFKPRHLDDLSLMEPLPTLFIANELFDNIPTRQFARMADGWQETLVDFRKGKLVLMQGETMTSLPNPAFAEHVKSPQAGMVYEISERSQALVSRLTSHVVQHRGGGLIIDYGYTSPPGSGTLDAWSQSRPTSILANPGKTDVTADVDFSALSRAALKQGAQTIIMNQSEFLLSLGIRSRVEALKRNEPIKTQKRIDDSFHELVSPTKMGELWKALIINGK